jgi:hypothetical protein
MASRLNSEHQGRVTAIAKHHKKNHNSRDARANVTCTLMCLEELAGGRQDPTRISEAVVLEASSAAYIAPWMPRFYAATHSQQRIKPHRKDRGGHHLQLPHRDSMCNPSSASKKGTALRRRRCLVQRTRQRISPGARGVSPDRDFAPADERRPPKNAKAGANMGRRSINYGIKYCSIHHFLPTDLAGRTLISNTDTFLEMHQSSNQHFL